jgi:hypothetical protein
MSSSLPYRRVRAEFRILRVAVFRPKRPEVETTFENRNRPHSAVPRYFSLGS